MYILSIWTSFNIIKRTRLHQECECERSKGWFLSFYIYSCHKSVWEMDKKSPSKQQTKETGKGEQKQNKTKHKKMKAKTFHICLPLWYICVLCHINNGVSKTLSHRCYLDGEFNGNRIDPQIILFYKIKIEWEIVGTCILYMETISLLLLLFRSHINRILI